MNLFSKSQGEWLEKGGSSEALAFIDTVVGNLHTKAVAEGIVHKELTDEVATEEVVSETTETEVVVTDETSTEATNASSEVETTEVVTETQPTIDMATIITETIFAAQKQYHETVVAPILAELKALKTANAKVEQKQATVFSWDLSNMLPAAAVASRIQKEFGTSPAQEVNGEAVEGAAITKKEVAAPVTEGNLLGNFLS
jgi:hypothetical protein